MLGMRAYCCCVMSSCACSASFASMVWATSRTCVTRITPHFQQQTQQQHTVTHLVVNGLQLQSPPLLLLRNLPLLKALFTANSSRLFDHSQPWGCSATTGIFCCCHRQLVQHVHVRLRRAHDWRCRRRQLLGRVVASSPGCGARWRGGVGAARGVGTGGRKGVGAADALGQRVLFLFERFDLAVPLGKNLSNY